MIFVLVGPTASGKSSLAVAYAKKHGAFVVNGDAFQCYREMNIGTAKPSLEERKEVPHYLFDIASVENEYTIYDYQRDLRKILDDLIPMKKDILIVGGSGLYLKSALYDFEFASPREHADMSSFETMDDESLYEYLKEIDSVSASQIHFHNRKRVLRAIQIYLESGHRKSDLIAMQNHRPMYDVEFIGIEIADREELYRKIDDRVDRMMKEGLLREVSELYEKYGADLRAFQAIGYKELMEGMQRGLPLEESVALIKKRTRNYAKRQYTYFKNQLPVRWFHSQEEAMNEMENCKGGKHGTEEYL